MQSKSIVYTAAQGGYRLGAHGFLLGLPGQDQFRLPRSQLNQSRILIRKRISIARALLRKTPVLLVDEATASLDNETSYEILNSIMDLQGYTRIIVTHDLNENILKRCTKIFTLKNGAVFESGTFQQLMQQKQYFYYLFTVTQD